MRNLTYASALVLMLTTGLLLGAVATTPEAHAPAATEAGISVWFSPDGGCTAAVVHEIEQARVSIDVQAYSFTSTAIAKALTGAYARHVRVTVILDKSNRTEQYTAATITSVTVKDLPGDNNGFVNSLIYSQTIGTIALKDVQTNNGGTVEGIAAHTLASYTRKDAAGKVVKKLSKLKAPVADADNDTPDDLVVAIV